ncbi:MAG: hypothetical protein MHPSP_003434, partial [Paramarteilia canceri]
FNFFGLSILGSWATIEGLPPSFFNTSLIAAKVLTGLIQIIYGICICTKNSKTLNKENNCLTKFLSVLKSFSHIEYIYYSLLIFTLLNLGISIALPLFSKYGSCLIKLSAGSIIKEGCLPNENFVCILEENFDVSIFNKNYILKQKRLYYFTRAEDSREFCIFSTDNLNGKLIRDDMIFATTSDLPAIVFCYRNIYDEKYANSMKTKLISAIFIISLFTTHFVDSFSTLIDYELILSRNSADG